MIEFACEEKVKLQKGVLKKLLAESWPWPKLNFTLNVVDVSHGSEHESPTMFA